MILINITLLRGLHSAVIEFKTNCQHNVTNHLSSFPFEFIVPVFHEATGGVLFHICHICMVYCPFLSLGHVTSHYLCVSSCRNQGYIGLCEIAALPWPCPSPSLYPCSPSARETSMVSDKLWGRDYWSRPIFVTFHRINRFLSFILLDLIKW